MAKANTPASRNRKSPGTARKSPAKATPAKNKPTVKSGTPKTSRAKKSAAAAAASATKTTDAVTPSTMKKDLEASAKPMPDVAKEPEGAASADPKPSVEVVENTEPKTRSEPTPTPPPPKSTPAAQGSSGGFWLLILGGVLAAALGFLASELDLLGRQAVNDDLRAQNKELRQMLSDQEARIAELESAEPAVAAQGIAQGDLDAVTTRIDGLSDNLAALDERLTVVEKQPVASGDGTSAAAIAAYERELATLQTTVQDMIESARNVEQATENAAAEARAREALADITVALGSGQPFADAVNTLNDAGQIDVPESVVETADSGVVTLSNLQDRFPDAARTALDAARAAGEVEGESGVGGFLRRQLGARSVAPREGDDPDAVLSRAGAAVRDGQLSAALAELDTLSPDTQAAIQDWLDDARARAAAEAAVQDLSQSLTAN